MNVSAWFYLALLALLPSLAMAQDQQQAIHDIFHIEDFDAFLASSGYATQFE